MNGCPSSLPELFGGTNSLASNTSPLPDSDVHATERLKYWLIHLLSLERDTMTLYEPTSNRSRLYESTSSYSAPALTPYPNTPYALPSWTSANPVKDMTRDAQTLGKLLQPVTFNDYSTLADQIFGSQLRQQHAGLEHVLNLLSERSRLHKHFLQDIDSRHIQQQERLFGARLHGRLDGYRRATRIEQTLIQLEEQRRQEELRFWADSAELRDRVFELAKEYGALKTRTTLLANAESQGDGYHE